MPTAIAMSGGIDSSVAAMLLKEQGRDLIGIYMRVPRHKENTESGSNSEEDDARAVAERLEIRFEVFDAAPVFGEVVDVFVTEYLEGRTPNPCVYCNRKIKFGKLVDFARSLGADRFATGHYARVLDGRIHTGLDRTKDQSYVLFGIERERLPFIDFPLGNHTKAEIRELAAPLGLNLASKKESQEICFVPDHKHPGFIRELRPGVATGGNFVSTSGEILGEHDGFERFTIGQRKGMRIGFCKRVYVVKIDPVSRNVVIGAPGDLERKTVLAHECNWHVPLESGGAFRSLVKIRYRTEAKPATVVPYEDGSMRIEFDEPRIAVAPGQYAVCYEGDMLIGGGKIMTAE